MRTIAILVLGTVKLLIGSTAADAVTVYFNDASRAPNDMFQIGGITITGTGGATSPLTTALGVGLGFDNGPGLAGEVAEQAHWPANGSGFDSLMGGDGLNFSVDGYINSITILPIMRIFSGSGDSEPVPDGLNLEFSTSYAFGQSPIVPANASGSVTLTALDGAMVSTCYLTPQPNSSPDYWFSGYRQGNLAQEQTLQWGFTVVSLDYTPIPEPGTTVLFLTGLIGLLYARRRSFLPGEKRL